MAKLYFRYGAMQSSKTMNLLAVAHTYRKQGKRVLIVKPQLDSRFGAARVVSRAGIGADADLVVTADSNIAAENKLDGVSCLLVDEAQFLTPGLVDQLRCITATPGIPVICYGLRTDFRTELFPGSQRLMELADTIEEIKVTCMYCTKKATCNLRRVDGVGTLQGPQILLGDEEYVPVCWRHFRDHTAPGGFAGNKARPVVANSVAAALRKDASIPAEVVAALVKAAADVDESAGSSSGDELSVPGLDALALDDVDLLPEKDAEGEPGAAGARAAQVHVVSP